MCTTCASQEQNLAHPIRMNKGPRLALLTHPRRASISQSAHAAQALPRNLQAPRRGERQSPRIGLGVASSVKEKLRHPPERGLAATRREQGNVAQLTTRGGIGQRV